MKVRDGEFEKSWFRASRFFNVGDDFYFTTREGPNIGPFKNHPAAERGLSLYIQCMQKEETSGIYASRVAMQGVWASTLYH